MLDEARISLHLKNDFIIQTFAKISFFIMPSINEHFYNMFKGQDLGFYVYPRYVDDDFNGETIEDIDLYYQPVQDPQIGIIFFLLRVPIVILGVISHLKLLSLMKTERGLVMEVTYLFSVAQMTFWPFWWLFTTSTDFIHPLNEVFGQWFCDFGALIIHLGRNVIAFHSVVVAIMRYYFIVHQDKVDRYGKHKVKRIFFWMSFIVPLVIVIIEKIEHNELDMFSFINKCYGKHHKTFLIETSTLDVFKRNFCEFESYDIRTPMGTVLNAIRRLSCILRTTLILLTSFNISEGIIYFFLFSHIIR